MNIQDFCFGDFTQDELNNYINSNFSNGVEFPWSTTTTELNSSVAADANAIEFGFDIKLNESSTITTTTTSTSKQRQKQFKQQRNSSSSSSSQNSSSSMDNQQLDTQQQQSAEEQQKMMQAAADTQRRNKKRRPPDYYKKDYPVEILKRELDAQQEQEQQQSNNTENPKNDDQDTNNLADSLQKKLLLNDNNNNTNTTRTTTTTEDDGSVEESSSTNSEEDSNTNNDNTTTPKKQPETNESTPVIENGNDDDVKKVEDAQQQKEPLQQKPSNPWGAPKNWSNLFKATSGSSTTTTSAQQSSNANTSESKSNMQNVDSSNLSATSSHNAHSTSSLHGSMNGGDQQSHISATNFDALKQIGQLFKISELKHSAPALQPRGLRNSQNWCYVNATLQALLACPPFYNLIRNTFVKIKNSNIDNKHIPCVYALGRFVNEFKQMIRPSTSDNTQKRKELAIGEPFQIDYFYNVLAGLQTDLTFKGRQEDAQEFLSFLLNRTHDEMVKCLDSIDPNKQQQFNTTSSSSQSNGYSNDSSHLSAAQVNSTQQDSASAAKPDNNDDNNDDDEWQEVGKKNRANVTRRAEFKQSPLSDIFCGQFRTALSQQGLRDKESISLEPFFTLPLDIQSDSIRNINDALDHFVKKEEILDVTHPETKQHIEAYKRISFEDLPPVLILYLKCFVYDKSGGIQKLFKRIDYQIDLEISKTLISQNQRLKLNEKKRTYKLFAVEYHQGEKATGGHYTTDVYHPGIVGWVRYDDANVKVITNLDVLKSSDKKQVPYLLYYRRTDLI